VKLILWSLLRGLGMMAFTGGAYAGFIGCLVPR
jgi:hypothetical protein